MKLFYSPTTNSFSNEITHGTRTVFVEDDKAQETALKGIDKAEAGVHTLLDAADDDEEKAVLKAKLDELAEERRLALLNPPMMEVTNPECGLPDDAVEISAERHAELMAAQADGKTWRPGADGLPEIAERVRSAEEVLAAARSQRDRELAATDWTQLPDALTAAKRKLWAAHRKALRELPAHIEEAMGNGLSVEKAADLVQNTIAASRPQ